MALVALQRDVEAYDDLINQYQRDVRGYKSDISAYNDTVAAYNNALKNDMMRYPSNYLRGYGNKPIPFVVNYGVSKAESFSDAVTQKAYSMKQINERGWKVGAAPGKSGYYYIYTNLPDAPGKFTTPAPAQPERFGGLTQAQQQGLYSPSMADQERGGLIEDVIRNNGIK